MAIWTEFHPLKKCVIGTLPRAEDIVQYTNLKNRYKGYFEHILYTAKEELDHLQRIIEGFGVATKRSIQNYPFHNGKTINTPPLMIRDFFTIYGENLFKGHLPYVWNKDLSKSCDHILKDFEKTYDLPSENKFYDDDFSKFQPEELTRPFFSTACVLKCGNDIIMANDLGREGNNTGKNLFIQWIKNINPNIKIHYAKTDGHIDGQIFLVRPGLLITCLHEKSLPRYFDTWEKIFVDNTSNQMLHRRNVYRHKKFHPVIAKFFYNFLQTNTEETYFNTNSLSIDENTILFTGVHNTLFKSLEQKGVTCIPVDMKATTFWDTGVHCATNDIERTGQLDNY